MFLPLLAAVCFNLFVLIMVVCSSNVSDSSKKKKKSDAEQKKCPPPIVLPKPQGAQSINVTTTTKPVSLKKKSVKKPLEEPKEDEELKFSPVKEEEEVPKTNLDSVDELDKPLQNVNLQELKNGPRRRMSAAPKNDSGRSEISFLPLTSKFSSVTLKMLLGRSQPFRMRAKVDMREKRQRL